MNVLHLWRSDSRFRGGGGGAGSMQRIHSNLRNEGIDSKILCEIKTKKSSHISVIRTWPRVEKHIERVTSKLGLNDVHRISSFRIKKHKFYLKADILNFHGIHTGFISYLALPSLTASKPSVFTLRDMWCLTGHCGFSYDCNRWKTGCGKCPYPEEHPPIKRDATRLEWKLKNWVYSGSNLIVVALSQWLADKAKQSMLNRFPIYHIPNGVDIEQYRPLDPDWCRYYLGIPKGKKVLLIAAVNLKDFRKGGDLLLKVLQSLPKSLKNELIILLMGKQGDSFAEASDTHSINLGYIVSDHLKAIAYSAADIYVSPTRAESFGQTILESLSCGTPVVAFNLGPVPELVRHGITGLLAESENPKELGRRITQLLEDKSLLNRMGKKGRSMALKEYSTDLETRRYIELYRHLLRL